MPRLSWLTATLILMPAVHLHAESWSSFARHAQPFLETYCIDCHDDVDQEGDVALHDLGEVTVYNAPTWKRVWEVVALNKMPPPKKKKQPALMERFELSKWVTDELAVAMKDHGGFNKHLHPKKANHLDHDLLFNTDLAKLDLVPASTPSRMWRIHPNEHMVRLNDLMSRQPFDPANPFGRTRGDYIVASNYGEEKVFFGKDRYLGHVGGYVAHMTSVKGFPALLNQDGLHGLRSHAHLYSVNGSESSLIANAAEDILRYMAYGAESLTGPDNIIADRKDRPDEKELAKKYGDLRGTTRGIYFSQEIKRPLTPVYDLAMARTASDTQIQEAVTYLFEALTHTQANDKILAEYTNLVKDSIRKIGKEDGVILGLSAIFLDPKALFRTELAEYGRPDSHGRVQLQGEELMLAINGAFSYIEPNKHLKAAHQKRQLTTKADVEREVRRILDDRSIRKPRILQFFREYFNYDLAPKIDKDDKDLSAFNAPKGNGFLRTTHQMVRDTDFLVEYIVDRDQQVLKELLTTDYIILGGKHAGAFFIGNDDAISKQSLQALANQGKKPSANKKGKPKKKDAAKIGDNHRTALALDSLTGPLSKPETVGVRQSHFDQDPFAKRALHTYEGRERKGILTTPAWLISHSDAMDNHAIHRGIWVLERLVGSAVPDVPITVDAMLPDEPGTTLRHRMRVTREEECWGCHKSMDQMGLPFEMFNHIGQFRDTEEGEPVDASGEILHTGDPKVDGPVTDAIDMITKLADSERAEQVFVRHVFRFWMGRNETINDAPILRAAHKAYRDSNGSMKELLVSLLTSDAFLYRTVK